MPPRAALDVIARPKLLPLRMMIADAARQPAYLADRTIIERAPPHERAQMIEEALAERDIARGRAGADEGRALPRKRRRFIMRDRHVDRHGQRRGFGCRTQTQIDTQHIAVGGALLQQFDDPPRIAHRRLDRLFLPAVRQRCGIEQQDRIDVRRIIELAAALLAECERDHAGGGHVRHTLADRGGDGAIERTIGEIAQRARDGFERSPGQIGQRHRQRDRLPFPPQRARRIGIVGGRRFGPGERGRQPLPFHDCHHIGTPCDQPAQERRKCGGPIDCVGERQRSQLDFHVFFHRQKGS
jgi:hypothetical protein